MPRQLIYTSAPRGLIPGQSGYCTVARSRDLREALIPRIEKLSYYTPEADRNPVICAHRIIDLRGTRFHILSRIVDAGLDFTKRRSFLAHHLIFEPNELSAGAAPAEILLNWKGWVESWTGEPQWLEDNRPIPATRNRDCTIAKTDVWVTGDEADRQRFLQTLAERGADWDITFTNCFQPGDNPADFDIIAAWPNTAGFVAAERLNAQFIRLNDLPTPAPTLISVEAVSQNSPVPKLQPVVKGESLKEAPRGKWRVFALVGAVLIGLVYFSVYRRDLLNPKTTWIEPGSPGEPVSSLAPLLPDRLTWLVRDGVPTQLPPIAEFMNQLRANKVFTKDITCTIQTNLLKPPQPAVVTADLEQNRLEFTATNASPIRIETSNLVTTRSDSPNSYSIELPGRFRIIAFKKSIELPSSFLQVTTNIQLHPDFEERIRRVELPPGAQFALRPIVGKADPIANAALDFSIVPSTILDLTAVHAHAHQVIGAKESKLREYEEEQARLLDEQRKLLTEPQTPEHSKKKERLSALDLAIPKAREEIELLRAKAAAIPTDANQIDRFALFLCLSNVNREIFRFSDKP